MCPTSVAAVNLLIQNSSTARISLLQANSKCMWRSNSDTIFLCRPHSTRNKPRKVIFWYALENVKKTSPWKFHSRSSFYSPLDVEVTGCSIFSFKNYPFLCMPFARKPFPAFLLARNLQISQGFDDLPRPKKDPKQYGFATWDPS